MTTNLHDSFICSFSQIYFKIKILKAYKISLKILLTIVNEKKRNTKVMKIVFWKFVSQHHYSGMFIFVSCCNKKASLPIESLFWGPEKIPRKETSDCVPAQRFKRGVKRYLRQCAERGFWKQIGGGACTACFSDYSANADFLGSFSEFPFCFLFKRKLRTTKKEVKVK